MAGRGGRQPISRCFTPRNSISQTARQSCFPLPWTEPTEQPDAEYDLQLNNGRLLEHFHEGNLTYRSEGIREKTPDTFVEVSPELAGERGIESGTLGAAHFALWQGPRASPGDRAGVGAGALYADEFNRRAP